MYINPKLLFLYSRQDSTDITILFRRSGFTVETVTSDDDVFNQITSFAPDLIISEAFTTKINGRELVRRLRHNNNWIPIILFSEAENISERTMAIEEGADDYLFEPLEWQELFARVRAILRRIQRNNDLSYQRDRLVCGDLVFDRLAHRVSLADRAMKLSPKAVSLLEYLMLHPHQVLTRERLLNVVWGYEASLYMRAVDTRIAELRRELKDNARTPQYIESIHGDGYSFIGNVKEI